SMQRPCCATIPMTLDRAAHRLRAIARATIVSIHELRVVSAARHARHSVVQAATAVVARGGVATHRCSLRGGLVAAERERAPDPDGSVSVRARPPDLHVPGARWTHCNDPELCAEQSRGLDGSKLLARALAGDLRRRRKTDATGSTRRRV